MCVYVAGENSEKEIEVGECTNTQTGIQIVSQNEK